MQYLNRLLTLLLAAIFLIAVVNAATQPQKSVIVSFPSDTPSEILEKAKEAVLKAGGFITHEYQIIKYVQSLTSALLRQW